MIDIKKIYHKYRSKLPILVFILFILFLLQYRLSSLLGGMNFNEINSINGTKNLTNILNNGVDLPYNLIQFFVNNLSPSSIYYFRIIPVIASIPMLIFFYTHLQNHYGKYTAPLTTVLIASSAWLLHSSRTATPDILFVSVIALLWFHTYIRTSKNYNLIFMIAILIAVFLTYIPGLIWFVILGYLWERNILKALIKKLNKNYFMSIILIGILMLIPLILSVVRYPNNLFSILGFPVTSPNLLDSTKLFIMIPINLFYENTYNPINWLSNLPFLDFATSVFFIIGVYQLIKNWQLNYSKVLLISFLFGGFLYSLGGPVSLTILIPSTYLIVASGLSFLIDRWFEVFPKNPISRYVGLSILSIAIFSIFFYQTRSYFVAWPNSKNVKSYYYQHPG